MVPDLSAKLLQRAVTIAWYHRTCRPGIKVGSSDEKMAEMYSLGSVGSLILLLKYFFIFFLFSPDNCSRDPQLLRNVGT